MRWEFNDETPIYLQIMVQVKEQIASGQLKPGDKMRPVREMAVEAGVNPNTMQKALSELEREGFLYSQRTSGRYVSENSAMQLGRVMAQQYIEEFVGNMSRMGYNIKHTQVLFNEYIKDMEEVKKNE